MPRVFMVLAGAVLAVQASGAASRDDAHARSLAATCASCHSTLDAAGAAARLDGRKAAELIAAMQDFQSGKRQGTVMPQLAKGYTTEQIAAIANWYAAHKEQP